MYQSKKQGKEINGWKTGSELKLFLTNITDCCNNYGHRNQEFNPFSRNINIIQCTQCEGDRMTNSKRSDQHDDPFPIIECITQTKRQYKNNMIISSKIRNLLKAQGKV